VSRNLAVNPIACEAHGMCAELLPELVSLDEWGYPVIDHRPVPAELLANAERAAAACPTFALLLERRHEPAAVPPRSGRPAVSASGVRNVRRRTPRMPDR
jgi:ferredoxin